jgi:hypothetical protein
MYQYTDEMRDADEYEASQGNRDGEDTARARRAKDIVDALSEEHVRTYLTSVIEALYCHEADGELDLEKEWSPDELDEIGRLLEPLVNS